MAGRIHLNDEYKDMRQNGFTKLVDKRGKWWYSKPEVDALLLDLLWSIDPKHAEGAVEERHRIGCVPLPDERSQRAIVTARDVISMDELNRIAGYSDSGEERT